MVWRRIGRLGAAALLAALGPALGAQAAPSGAGTATRDATALIQEGRELLEREDLPAACRVFREVRRIDPAALEGLLGLGRVHLALGSAQLALAYAREAVARAPAEPAAAALHVRALIRARAFDRAAATAARYAAAIVPPGPELLAAQASALFRLQKVEESARIYREVVRLDPFHGEAHLRLGSGLTAPRTTDRTKWLEVAAGHLRRGAADAAVGALRQALDEDPGNPIAHRLLGETLLAQAGKRSIAATAPEFRALRAALQVPPPTGPVHKFIPMFADLDGGRRQVAARATRLFASYVPRLVAIGGRHDLLTELQRTTDDGGRQALRGRRTFDGRVWDDVRGIGGLRAATGIEALDEARDHGFDTLSHEVAHQVHLYAMKRADRMRIRSLYRRAQLNRRFLDYYAASNEAEYFAQGVEAFVSLGKRPCRESTHGHTRFELYRRDRALHDLIAELVDEDMLADPRKRAEILPLAAAVALRCGRAADALVAADMMPPGDARDTWRGRARRALRYAQAY